MRRLQTLVVALSLLVAMACNAAKPEPALHAYGTPIEQNHDEEIVTSQGDDSTFVQNFDKEAEPLAPKSETRTIPIGHLLWLLLPAIAVAVLGYICKKKISDDMSAEEELTAKWLIGSELLLYVVELLLFVVLFLLGVFEGTTLGSVLLTALIAILFMSLNAYGAFTANAAILRKYDISFTWKKVLVYVGIALAVDILFVIFMPLVFDAAIFNSRIILPNIIVLCTVLCLLFGIDMYNQNAKSLRAIPVVFLLFTIGMLMSGSLILAALLIIGLCYVIKNALAKEDEAEAELEEEKSQPEKKAIESNLSDESTKVE